MEYLYKTRIEGSLFKISKFIAEEDYKKYCDKKGEQQNPNTMRSCFVGILGERTAFLYLNNKYSNVIDYCVREKEFDKREWTKADIHFEKDGKEQKAEVKTIRKGSPKGQVLVKHGNKYLKEAVSGVVFVEIQIYEDYADCGIYAIEKPEKIVTFPISDNFFGGKCYTIKKYLKKEK